ncbi:MAG: hypothetical protein Q9184_008565 [Pyrenodesmia sp. 2 TL-2023]
MPPSDDSYHNDTAPTAAAAVATGGRASYSLPRENRVPNGRQTSQSRPDSPSEMPMEKYYTSTLPNIAHRSKGPRVDDYRDEFDSVSPHSPTTSSENGAHANQNSGGAPRGGAAARNVHFADQGTGSLASETPGVHSLQPQVQPNRDSETAACSPITTLDIPISHHNHQGSSFAQPPQTSLAVTVPQTSGDHPNANTANHHTEETETRPPTLTTSTTTRSDNPPLSGPTAEQTPPSPSSLYTGRGRPTPLYPTLPSLTRTQIS